MIGTMDCGEARVCLGAYVLGSIDPAERSLVDAHLATCRDCRDELAGLAGLPALLARVGTEEAAALAGDAPPGEPGSEEHGEQGTPPAGQRSPDGQPPEELLGSVLHLVAARRRRRRWRTAGLSAAAAVILAVAAFGGVKVAAGDGTGSPPAAAGLNYGAPSSGWTIVHGEAAGMVATVRYRQMGWGTQVAAKVVGIPVGTYCTLVVLGAHGTRTTIGGWTTDTAEGTIWYPASSGIAMDQMRGFQVTVAGHKTISIDT